MKRLKAALLTAAIALQLIVPGYMIWSKYDVLLTGQEVKMRTEPIDPYDAFRGRYVSLWFDLGPIEREGRYGVLEIGEDGFARVARAQAGRPAQRLYLVSGDDEWFQMPFDRYYMEETLAPRAEQMLADGENEAYVTIRIKGDKSVISGLYINDVEAERLLGG